MATTDQATKEWQAYDFDQQTIIELQTLTKKDIDNRFKNRLKFGTAGLRAPMGVGSNRMNSLTVLQTTQGLCKYLMEKKNLTKETIKNKGTDSPSVVIGFDGRYNSEKFAHVAASVFISQHFKVFLFSVPTPTPLTPFIVAQFKCIAGIQVTASHNPKEDNGYKLYGESGAQIVPPMDSEIEAHIGECLVPWKDALNCLDMSGNTIKLLNTSSVCHDPMSLQQQQGVEPVQGAEMANEEEGASQSKKLKLNSAQEMYLDMMTKELSANYKSKNFASKDSTASDQRAASDTVVSSSKLPLNPKFVYTAMHGVGWSLLSKLWAKFELNPTTLIPVEIQKLPDPEFPTVVFPNPEEKGALDIAIQEANQLKDVGYVLANDPDADRFTAAEKLADGSWKLFNGDELGILFADWQYIQFMNKYHGGDSGDDDIDTGLFITSVVSSRMLSKFASIRSHCKYKDTLTGFKFMSNESIETRKQHANYVHLLAYEEAIGYQLSGSVPDKDGVSAACVWADMVKYYRTKGKLIFDHLKELQQELGLFITNNGYFVCNDPKTIDAIFDEFRSNNYTLGGEGNVCLDVNDVTLGIGSKNLPATPKAQMIQFVIKDVIVTLRASGTEPKLKYYTEHAVMGKTEQEEAKGRQLLSDVVDILTKGFYQPDKFDVRKG